MEHKAHILLVEDDQSLAFVIRDNLVKQGYTVSHATNGKEALRLFDPAMHKLCILDVMLPQLDGFTCAGLIREKDSHTPILFLTAKSMEEDKLEGFRQGGDDYITKPFSFQELLCRIEVFLKRSVKEPENEKDEPANCYRMENVFFHYPNLKLTVGDEEHSLTQKEADLLRLFFDRKNSLLKREEILTTLWGDDDYFMGRSLDVFISRLRKYLTNARSLEIRNHHGVGFQLVVSK